MTNDFKKNDAVSWKSSQGEIKGKVVKKVTQDIDIQNHHVKASKEDPQYLVKSTKTKKKAAHKPGALKKIKNT